MKVVKQVSQSFLKFEGESDKTQAEINARVHKALGVREDGFQYSPAYKRGVWDGYTNFYNKKTGGFATGLLDLVDEELKRYQEMDPSLIIEYENEYPERWVDETEFPSELTLPDDKLGNITLRDYQYESVKSAVLAQMGIVHVATNGGKCIPADTTILTNKGLMTIGNLFKESNLPLANKEEVVRYAGDTHLVNRHGKLEKPSHLTYNGKRKVFQVTTDRGFTEKATGNHPFLTVAPNGTFRWVNTEDLQEGMWIVSRKGDNVFGDLQVSADDAYLLGAIVADGYINQDTAIKFTNDQEELITFVADKFSKLGRTVVTPYTKQKGTDVRLSDKQATIAYHRQFSLGYGVAKDKDVPASILGATREAQLNFLSGYLECESSIEVPKCAIEVTSASRTLLQQVQMVLLNLGYVSTLAIKNVKGYEHTDYYRLTLGAIDSHKLLQELTFKTAQRKAQRDKFNKAYSSRTRNPKGQTVPFGKELVKEYVGTYPNVPSGMRKAFYFPKTISVSRLRDLTATYHEGETNSKMVLDNLLSEEFVYSQVVILEEAGEIDTYDVCMPDTHSFIANGMVNHNTEIGSSIIAQLLPQMEKHEHIVFFVPSKEIFYGAIERLSMRLGGIDIGYMGDGKKKIEQVNVVLMPSLVSALKDPTKGVKVTQKERIPQIIVQDILPQFKGKKNVKTLLQNYVRGYNPTTKIGQRVREELSDLSFSDLSDAKIQLAMNKYEVTHTKNMKKKVDKKYDAYQETLDFVSNTVCVICDEVHRAKGETWFNSIMQFTNAQYRIGMTGTIDYKNKVLWRRLQGLFGDVVNRVRNEELIDRGFSAKPLIQMVNIKTPQSFINERDYQKAYSNLIVNNEVRNNNIADLTNVLVNDGRTVLIVVNFLEHGDNILKLLSERNVYAEFINGELDSEVRRRQLSDVKEGKLKVLVATTVLDEGVDISGIHALIMTAGGKSLRQTLQRVGRILRRKEGDNSAIVIDFVDRTNKHLFKHSEERLKLYEQEGFKIQYLN